MTELTQLVVFCLDEQRYALPLRVVERIVRVAEVAPLPNAPATVLGVIDVGGQVLPVFNLRQRFRLPERAINPADHLLIAHTGFRRAALLIDEARGVIEIPPMDVSDINQIVPGVVQVCGVVIRGDGLVLIHDLEKFLSLDEEYALDQAILEGASHGA
jgi:purine-binding chemotaxis protein CheW